ncbi:MAG: LPXTG cell wall anchor domain-containing protein, partial [Candidatus Limosilactobacillus intestinavium]
QKNAVHAANVAKIAQKTLNDDTAKLTDLVLAVHNETKTTVDSKTVDDNTNTDNNGANTNVDPTHTASKENSNKVSLGNNTVAVLPAANADQSVKATLANKSVVKNDQNDAAKSNNLPQTGNENSAAVMALGAVSAMLGLGMVAKKREF